MAKIQGPLFSVSAAGSVGKVIQFRRLAGLAVAGRLSVPLAPPTAAQMVERSRCSIAAAAWRDLDADTRNLWIALSVTHNLNPWLEFWREWQFQRIEPPDLPELPAD